MTDSLSKGYEVPTTKTIGGEIYRVHANGRKNPYAYWNEDEAEGAAKRLRSLGWSARVYKHTVKADHPNARYPYILYKRKG